MEDFIYSKTSHLGYIRDHRSRAGLSALTTSSPETLSIHPSIPASRKQRQYRAVHAFKPNSLPLHPNVQGRAEAGVSS